MKVDYKSEKEIQEMVTGLFENIDTKGLAQMYDRDRVKARALVRELIEMGILSKMSDNRFTMASNAVLWAMRENK
jgi:predicted transcriptional regulator